MPAYLCHGFRWHRRSVRVFVIVQNLDDASPEWIIPPKSAQSLLEAFYNLFDFLPYCVPPPRSGSGYGSSTLRTGGAGSEDDESYVSTANSHGGGNGRGTRSRSQSAAGRAPPSSSQKSRSRSGTRSRQQSNPPPAPSSQVVLGAHGTPVGQDDVQTQDWSVVKLLEEYDPMNLEEMSRPYAYVADYAVRIDLSASIMDEIAAYEERVRADRDPPVTGPSDEGAAAVAGGKKKSGKKQQGAGTGWFERLRDQLQRGEEIRWYVVNNGDEVREWPDEPESKVRAARQEHHSQYTLQQQIFADGDKVPRVVRGSDRGKERAKQKMLPPKDMPSLKPRTSVDTGLRPKTPSKGGFRRLFGRGSKAEGLSP
jgi:hypothetical protein